MLLKSDVTRRDHMSATAQSSHNSEIYNIGAHAQ